MAVKRSSQRRLAGVMAATGVVLALGAGTALPAFAAPAEGKIENAGAAEAIKNSYIVVLEEEAPDAGSSAGKSLAKRFGADVEHTYKEALNGYAVTMTEAEAKKFAADPAVKSVVQNEVVHAVGTQTGATWGLDRLDQAALPLNGSYTYPDSAGQGVTAYVIDTGVRISHSDFGGRAFNGYDAVDNDNVAQDGNGHGTHVAGTIAGNAYGVAKKAKIVGVRVLDNNGSGTTAGVIKGIDWVTANAQKPAVANMSLGGGASTALDDAVRNSIASGVTYAVAAGNDNANASNYSPARVAEAITVGSTTSSDARSSFSNYGSILDIFAPGSSITSTWNTSDTATNTISGTSMATPHVAGAAALYLADNTSATPAQVSTALVNNAVSNVVTSPGTGSPNKLLNVGSGGTTPPAGPRFENTANYNIVDRGTVESPITVTGVSGNAPSALQVGVDIKHTYSGDLQIDLVAPDGTAYRMKSTGTGGSADNVITTYTVNASSEVANGTWKLRVYDAYTYDTGYIDSWSLQF
ncbi:S8 family serine peptidase [Streptomyces sp. SCUT-3]|uniref:S8 family peptidase n=1 Tax=Streptomyces TaxID=1883 RepID=UPI000CA7D643|nr:S8 family peptidase [Streptomyces sp. SCUT-3]PLW71754.1 serine protease [Streptomyces sp. DJ]QMV21923.1 S8 family serine peptidase [Streptomyces sp. SCUT-3]